MAPPKKREIFNFSRKLVASLWLVGSFCYFLLRSVVSSNLETRVIFELPVPAGARKLRNFSLQSDFDFPPDWRRVLEEKVASHHILSRRGAIGS